MFTWKDSDGSRQRIQGEKLKGKGLIFFLGILKWLKHSEEKRSLFIIEEVIENDIERF